MYKYDFSGKTTFITGGAEGIGREFVETFALQGSDIAVCDVQDDKLAVAVKEVAEKSGRKIVGYHCDVRHEDEVRDTVAKVIAEFGKIDILINNAGRLNYGPLAEYSLEQWCEVIDTDLTGMWLVSKEVMNQTMVSQGKGRIINVTSIAGHLGTPAGCPSYHAAKAGTIGLTIAQAVEYAPYGVLVNGVAPGTILNGGMTSRSKVASNPDTHKKGRNPMKRAGTFGEMSAAAIALAADENTYITGQNIAVDGGISITL
jgi:gluconate 5-dehydrogenase